MSLSTRGLEIETILHQAEATLVSGPLLRASIDLLRASLLQLRTELPNDAAAPEVWSGVVQPDSVCLIGDHGMMTALWVYEELARFHAQLSGGRAWHISWSDEGIGVQTAVDFETDANYLFQPDGSAVDYLDSAALIDSARSKFEESVREFENTQAASPEEVHTGPLRDALAIDMVLGTLKTTAARTLRRMYREAVSHPASSPQPERAKCAQCHAALKENAKFCVECGSPVPPREKVCKTTGCGNKILPGEKFCSKCGTRAE